MQVCTPCRQPRQHPTTQFFTGRMPFLTPNQQRQSTEGTCAWELCSESWDVCLHKPCLHYFVKCGSSIVIWLFLSFCCRWNSWCRSLPSKVILFLVHLLQKDLTGFITAKLWTLAVRKALWAYSVAVVGDAHKGEAIHVSRVRQSIYRPE